MEQHCSLEEESWEMKLRLIIFTLVFTMVLSPTSFAEWTKMGFVNADGGVVTFYLDYERIRKHAGYVYYWTIADHSTRSDGGYMSSMGYWRGDCKLFRVKNLVARNYSGQMGRGDNLATYDEEDANWTYPTPNSPNEWFLEDACAR